jgi:flagellar protein FliS
MTSNPYQQQSIATAGPAQLVLMMYDGALAAIARARQAQAEGLKGLPVVNDELQRAQAIIRELLFTLDHEKGGAVAANMASLYDFSIDRLIRANVSKDLTLLDPVVAVVQDLRDAWEASCCRMVAVAG